MRFRRIPALLPAAILSLTLLPASLGALTPEPPVARQAMNKLIRAYPTALCSSRDNLLLWCDGTAMPFDDGLGAKNFQTLLENPDLQDQLSQPYPRGPESFAAPAENMDPGRVRYEPFFRKMYGSTQAEVRRHLVAVPWPFGPGGASLQVTRVNGVDARLREVIAELKALPRREQQILQQRPGAYFWRNIAGTSRPSMHSFGIALDVGIDSSSYWQWDRDRGKQVYENSMPRSIVEIFEKHGFIWGGKWHHYDTMHFEYRPELLGQ